MISHRQPSEMHRKPSSYTATWDSSLQIHICEPSRAELTAALPHSLVHGRLSQGSGWGFVDYHVAFVTTVTIQSSLVSKWPSSCLSFPNAGITGACDNVQLDSWTVRLPITGLRVTHACSPPAPRKLTREDKSLGPGLQWDLFSKISK